MTIRQLPLTDWQLLLRAGSWASNANC